ncbi:glycosyltransferase [Bosea sp. Root381]|uniref:glycosyltransferase family 2 protein n=1 Tax=Bosea sp. Root381 TaxID=1736524 RepID=UPI00138F5612|nr:glycosyltransferase [Bosea sp. Root381]
MEAPVISVVINTNGRRESLATTLEALRLQTYRHFEICIVCGPGPDGTREFVAEQVAVGALKAADCDERNLSVSRNIGIALAAGEFVAFIDDDAIPEPVWLEQLLAGIGDDPLVAGIGGMVFQPNGRDLQFRFSTCDRFGNARHDVECPADASAFPLSAHFPHVMGTNAMFRRQALVAVGGFDEEYDYYLDEADLCCRLVDAGYAIRQRGDAPVHHQFLSGTVRDGEGITAHFYPILKNQLYFALVNGRSHATLPRILDSARDFTACHRADIAGHVARGALHKQALVAFDEDHDRATLAALSRGLSGGRRLQDASRFDAPPAFLPAALAASREADGSRRHVVIVAQESGAAGGVEDARARARGLAEAGDFVRVLLLAAARSRMREGVALRGGVWHHVVYGESSGDDAATLAAALRRIARYHPIDAVENPDGFLTAELTAMDA